MNVAMLAKPLWPILLVMFLGIAASQLSESLKAKTGSLNALQANHATLQSTDSDAMLRTNALLGAACVIVAAFWGFDAVLSWWMRPAS